MSFSVNCKDFSISPELRFTPNVSENSPYLNALKSSGKLEFSQSPDVFSNSRQSPIIQTYSPIVISSKVYEIPFVTRKFSVFETSKKSTKEINKYIKEKKIVNKTYKKNFMIYFSKIKIYRTDSVPHVYFDGNCYLRCEKSKKQKNFRQTISLRKNLNVDIEIFAEVTGDLNPSYEFAQLHNPDTFVYLTDYDDSFEYFTEGK